MPFGGKIPKVNPNDHRDVVPEPIRDGRTLSSWLSAKAALMSQGMTDIEAEEYLYQNPGSLR